MGNSTNYHQGRRVNDADSHITESRGWLESYCSDYVRKNLHPGIIPLDMPELDPLMAMADNRLAGNDPKLTEVLTKDLFGSPGKRNLWAAYGAIDKYERSKSLDIAGISRQLVFPSIAAARFSRSKDLKVVYGGCDGLNRAMVDFCSDDHRLIPVGYVAFADAKLALKTVKEGIKKGVKTFWIRADAEQGRAPSHISYDSIWAAMEEADVSVALHIGSGVNMTAEYMNTGVERVLEGNFANIESTKPKDIPVLHHAIERWLTCMIFDGVLERFPRLMIGFFEVGANWLPASMANMDIGVRELGKFDIALRALSMKPSDYIRRQIRVAPLHMEDTGWILRNVGKDILMFNTDYPHPEGGKDPYGAFNRSLNAVNPTDEELDHFYAKNFESYLNL